MSTLSQRLRDLRIGLFPDIETVNEVLDECIAQAEAQEAQAIVEPVEKPNDWSNPEYRAKVFLERMLRLREDVSRWQGKCAVLRHENNRLRKRPSQATGEPVAWMAECLHDYRMDIITDAWKKDAPSDGNMSKTFTIPLYRSPISPEARDIAIDPKASPSGIPFSVALEYLKAGRKAALKGWVFAWIQAHPVYGISFHRGYDDVVQCFAVTEGAPTAMMGSDWMVLPEQPQNP